MFAREKKCEVCKEKDKQIEYLKEQAKDLQDRLLAKDPRALAAYNEITSKEPIPIAPMKYLDDEGHWRTLNQEETKEWYQDTNQILAGYVQD